MTENKKLDDGFFADLGNTKPYLKVAFQGFAGSGKTRTMAALAIGLHARIRSTKPIVSFDTEKAMHALKPLFDDAKIHVVRKESRSLADLKETMRRCREGFSDVLMIDSISHVWEEYLQAYQKKKNRTKLQFEDWGVIKPLWKEEFSNPFVRDPYHTLMAGRAGYQYDDEKDAEGHRQIYKSGVKMKVEGETAYEPDMLVFMERFEEILGRDKAVWREATIIKDRSELIDGKTFKNPKFEDFAPAVDRLLANAAYSIPAEQDTGAMFGSADEQKKFAIRRDIALEKIEGELTSAWPGATAEAKRAKVDALQTSFGTKSWEELKRKPPELLEFGLEALVGLVAKAREATAAEAST